MSLAARAGSPLTPYRRHRRRETAHVRKGEAHAATRSFAGGTPRARRSQVKQWYTHRGAGREGGISRAGLGGEGEGADLKR